MEKILYYQNYTHVGDVITLITCIVLFLLLASTYTVRERNIRLFRYATCFVIVASLSSIGFHSLAGLSQENTVWLIYVLRFIKDATLILDFVVFCIYIRNIGVNLIKKDKLMIIMAVLYIMFILAEIITMVTKKSFYVDDKLIVHQNYFLSPFLYAYVLFCLIAGILLFVERSKMVTKVFYCLLAVTILSVSTVVIGFLLHHVSYTCVSFTFPIVAVLFLFHHNAYDVQTGMLDIKAYVGYMHSMHNKKFSMIWLSLQNMTGEKMNGLSEEFYHFNEKFFRTPYTFRVSENRFVVVFEDDKNKDAVQKYPKLLVDFNRLYQRYLMDYKIVFVHAHEELNGGEDYLSLAEFIEQRISINSSFQCESRDVQDYIKAKYILSELSDIHLKQDFNDPRVKVYCQPVLDVTKGCFTSAEALMRLELTDCGFVFPDEFIPMAEKYDYIHTLSRIILNKTCQEIKRLLDEGYELDRISVNFAITELRDTGFSMEVLRIIRSNGIPYSKVAVELTESMNETEFENVKTVMTKLNQAGVKFYLDDFGTGYSNFDRIVDLPIDIIKFDRSLTVMSGKDDNSRFMVESFSDIFKNSNYQILFEGVEDVEEEERCKEMNAVYLQGYKYSKPIPIEKLRDFLNKN